jgi:hypothetical protein
MSPRAAQVRFYIDADILGLGKILGRLRNDVTYPGDPGAVIPKWQREPCPIASPDALDTDWIPEVASRDPDIPAHALDQGPHPGRAPCPSNGGQEADPGHRAAHGLGDRGTLQPGMTGDVNVIDYANGADTGARPGKLLRGAR